MSRGTDPIEDPRPTQLALPVNSSRDHVLGPATAKVTLLEYGDYECPDCGRAYPLLGQLREQFGDDLQFAFRHFPLYSIHRHASAAAQAAEAAGAQGKFWPMHDLLYQNQSHLEIPDFTHHALKLGLEVYQFEQALSSGRFARRVEEDYIGGEKSGVRGTPTLFVKEERYDGPLDAEAIAVAIRAALQSV